MKKFLIFLAIIAVFIAGVFVATQNNPLSNLMREPGDIDELVGDTTPVVDNDNDGVAEDDRCPNNSIAELTQGVYQQGAKRGCPMDSDQDGVADYQDDCLGTPSGISVDEKGCPISNVLTTPPSGQVFRDRLKDGSDGPEMVVISGGRFRMGDIQSGGDFDEKPVHSVSVENFAMGRYEVTNEEFVRFLNAENRQGTQQPWFETKKDFFGHIIDSVDHFSVESSYEKHPVVNISRYGATAYVEWLSQQTGQTYRLPTEAEWEYAARAGSTTKYWWGNDIGTNQANCYSNYCGDRFQYTAPVGSFAPNPFGLYDTVGNVWEWTCSKYTDKYNGEEQHCSNSGSRLVLRGGDFDKSPRFVRAADRLQESHGRSSNYVGFRLAKSY